MQMRRYFAHGKILISGEYVVLRGAEALAIPTRLGQSLLVEDHQDEVLWESIDHQGNTWFKAVFDLNLKVLSSTDESRAAFIEQLLKHAALLSGKKPAAEKFTAKLDFPANWGLGSSSTLTYLLAQHYQADAFELFFATQNGSGYDIACAGANEPLIYQLHHKKARWASTPVSSLFREAYFVFLNQKQDSRQEVTRFQDRVVSQAHIEEISDITHSFTSAKTIEELKELVSRHESIMGQILGKEPIGRRLFPDYQGVVKSLGAWGGDFAMAVGSDTPAYFRQRGYDVILKFDELFHSSFDK